MLVEGIDRQSQSMMISIALHRHRGEISSALPPAIENGRPHQALAIHQICATLHLANTGTQRYRNTSRVPLVGTRSRCTSTAPYLDSLRDVPRMLHVHTLATSVLHCTSVHVCKLDEGRASCNYFASIPCPARAPWNGAGPSHREPTQAEACISAGLVPPRHHRWTV